MGKQLQIPTDPNSPNFPKRLKDLPIGKYEYKKYPQQQGPTITHKNYDNLKQRLQRIKEIIEQQLENDLTAKIIRERPLIYAQVKHILDLATGKRVT